MDPKGFPIRTVFPDHLPGGRAITCTPNVFVWGSMCFGYGWCTFRWRWVYRWSWNEIPWVSACRFLWGRRKDLHPWYEGRLELISAGERLEFCGATWDSSGFPRNCSCEIGMSSLGYNDWISNKKGGIKPLINHWMRCSAFFLGNYNLDSSGKSWHFCQISASITVTFRFFI